MKGKTISSSISRGTRAGHGRRTMTGRALRRFQIATLVLGTALGLGTIQLAALAPSPAVAAALDTIASEAESYAPISGAGSTWAYPAIHAWIDNLQQYGLTINFDPNGSTSGREFFSGGQVDFGASEIPYGIQDGNNLDPPPSRGYDYIPDVAGGTTFMYNLYIDGRQVTNLRLSGQTIAEIFTNKITMWNNPQIEAENPDLKMPALQITPVVRSDGSGATADFTQWMLALYPSYWKAYCAAVGFSPCTQTSAYPVQAGTNMIGQPGDPGVATYVSQSSSDGAIGYVEYSWALAKGFPVAAVLNADGYYTLPTPGNVAISLLQDQLNLDPSSPDYLTQNLSKVYTNTAPNNYELSAYSYLILPTDTSNNMSDAKGYTIGTFGSYLLCLGQSQVDPLGYSALPINLVEDGFDQLRKVPGAQIPAEDTAAIEQCDNPTFSPNGTNLLADQDPPPPPCAHEGSVQCTPAQMVSQGDASLAGSSGGGVPTVTLGGGSSGGSSGGGSSGGASGSSGGGTSAAATATKGASGSATKAAGGSASASAAASGTGGASPAASSQPVSDTPITLASSNGDGVEVMLMALAAGLMFLLSVVPPLIAQAGRRSRQRRGLDEFYDRDYRPGDEP